MSTPVPATFEPVELPSKYAKAIVGLITAVISVVVIAFQDDVVTPVELANIGIAILTAFFVYILPNLPRRFWNWTKALVAVAGTVLQALIPFIANGEVTTEQWLLVLLAGLGALGVGIVPNNTEPPRVVEVVDGEVVQVIAPPEVTASATVTPTGKHLPPTDPPLGV